MIQGQIDLRKHHLSNHHSVNRNGAFTREDKPGILVEATLKDHVDSIFKSDDINPWLHYGHLSPFMTSINLQMDMLNHFSTKISKEEKIVSILEIWYNTSSEELCIKCLIQKNGNGKIHGRYTPI